MAAFGLDPTLALVIAGILVLIGLLLAFWGRGILRFLMAIIGMLIGGIIGYVVGATVITGGGALLAIGLGLVGAFLGLILFWKLVKIGFALVLGLLAAVLVLLAFGVPQQGAGVGDTRVIAAILVFLVVFAVSYYFIEELIGIITALIGGILVGVGAFLFIGPDPVSGVASWIIAAAAGAVIFFVGAASQTMRVRRQKRIASAISQPPAVAYPPPPPPPPR